MMLQGAIVCLSCGCVPKVHGRQCPDCGQPLSAVRVETAITLTALETLQKRRRQQQATQETRP